MLRHLITAITLCLLAPAAHAAELKVPGDYPSVQAALDAAAGGDTVRVAPGTYQEMLRLKDGVQLEGEDMATVIIQCGPHAGSALSANGVSGATVRNMTFEHSSKGKRAKGLLFPFPVVLLQGGQVRMEGCTIRNGVDVGVYIYGGESMLERCVMEDNASTGCYCWSPGMGVSIRECAIRNNRLSGLSLYSEDMRGLVEKNVFEGNGRYAINALRDTDVQFSANEMTRNSAIAYVEVQQLLRENRFADIEAIATRLRDEKLRYENGEWQLGYFYNFLTTDVSGMNDKRREEFFGRIEAWKKEFPDSITWRLVQARAFMGTAWHHRGSGYSSEVSEEGWAGYRENIQKAWDALDEASGLESLDPEYYTIRAALTMEMPRGPRNTPTTLLGMAVRAVVAPFMSGDRERTPFVKGVAQEPLYYPLYYERTRALLPRWGGSIKAMVRFAERSADDTRDIAGDTLYAVIVSRVADWEDEETLLERYKFSWPRIKAGFERILQDYPESHWRRNYFCRFACMYRDKETAAKLFPEILNAADMDVWGNKYRYRAYRNWALNGVPYPEPSPLEKAVVDGDARKVESLLMSGADANTLSIDGESMLMMATAAGDATLVKMLLAAGADPKFQNETGESVLRYAVYQESSKITKLVLDAGADPNSVSADGWTILMSTVYWERYGNTRLLLEAGADPNRFTQAKTTALREAIETKDKAFVNLLLEHGADPNLVGPDGTLPLILAVNWQYTDIALSLLDHGADPNRVASSIWTALRAAAKKGDLEMTRILIEHGADVNFVTEDASTALLTAVKSQSVPVCNELLEKGADPNFANATGWTPLFSAADKGNLQIAKLLIEHGAKVDAVETDGWSPFHMATKNGATPVVEYLLDQYPQGAVLVTQKGCNLLHQAAKSGHIDLVRLFLEKGLDVNAVETESGKTALKFANEGGYEKIAALLREHGATE